ncbi:MAG: hypothetical protein NTV75_11280 [Bacteroidia bacterium]|nr:hypothetical protein [Bacteroidia bacterium]
MKDFILKYLFRIDPNTPGQNLLKSFTALFPEATNVEWSKEKENRFEVIFRINGNEQIALFEKSGKWLRTETNCKIEELDESIREKLEAFGQIMSSIYREKANNVDSYEFIIRDHFQVRHIFITDSEGNITERRNFDEGELL